MKYKLVRNREQYVNSEKNLILRKLFAKTLIQVISSDILIINFDESLIQELPSSNKSWQMKGQPLARTYKRTFSGMQVLLAITSDGAAYF